MPATVHYEVRDHIATITVDNPERRNAISPAILDGLFEALAAARVDTAVRVVVLTGAGEKAFCAGGDLTGPRPNGALEAHDRRGQMAEFFRTMYRLGKPTIAKVRGYALAGGFGLALSCDIVIAAEDAVFGTPEVNVGMWPMLITVPMLRSMPPKVALELQLSGRRVSADEALRLGFVNRVVPVAELDEAVAEIGSNLASKAPAVVRIGRDSFYRVLDQSCDDALNLLQSGLGLVMQTEDHAEGIQAFRDKREPQWTGR
ncbi:enoyl-CoA hydratase-related protein [Mycobacterium syngnathidarum]